MEQVPNTQQTHESSMEEQFDSFHHSILETILQQSSPPPPPTTWTQPQLAQTSHSRILPSPLPLNSCGLSNLSPQDEISASIRSKQADTVLALLSNYGLSRTQISKLVRSHPRVLAADPEKTLAPKIDFFINVGLSGEDLARVLTFNPQLLLISLEKQIVPFYNLLRSLISQQQVVTLLNRRSLLFLVDFSKNMVPNIELLREVGVPKTHISFLVYYYNRVLMHNHEDLVQLVNEVKEMGFNAKKTTFFKALRALCGESCKSRYNHSREIYRSWGWSDDDIALAFRKNPQCMSMSEMKIMQTMEFLVNMMRWSARMVATDPVVLSFSLERIIPRCHVVKILMSKGLVNENLSLSSVLMPAEKVFLEKFVTGYLGHVPQLLGVYKGKLDFQAI